MARSRFILLLNLWNSCTDDCVSGGDQEQISLSLVQKMSGGKGVVNPTPAGWCNARLPLTHVKPTTAAFKEKKQIITLSQNADMNKSSYCFHNLCGVRSLKISCCCVKNTSGRGRMILQLQGSCSARCNVAVVTQARNNTHITEWADGMKPSASRSACNVSQQQQQQRRCH